MYFSSCPFTEYRSCNRNNIHKLKKAQAQEKLHNLYSEGTKISNNYIGCYFYPENPEQWRNFQVTEQEKLLNSSTDASFLVRYCCLASGLFPFEESLNTLKADADCPQNQRVWKRHCGWKYAIWKSRHAPNEVHSNLSYQWIRSDELLPWARCWCVSWKSTATPLQKWATFQRYANGTKIIDLPSAKKLFGLLYIHPIEYELHLSAIPFLLNWFPWNAILVS